MNATYGILKNIFLSMTVHYIVNVRSQMYMFVKIHENTLKFGVKHLKFKM